jgi:hypothetical protein
MRRSSICTGLALLLGGIAAAQEMEVQVELMGPLGTQTSHKGDRVFGRVTRPDGFKGDTVEGRVTEVRGGNKLRGTSTLNFTFETLQHAGQAIPISSQVKSLANSKGQTDVDEEGRVVRKSSNVGKALGGTALGGLIGGLAGGGKGAAIGAGAGAAASIVLIEVACEGPAIRFDPGSRVTIAAKTREGSSLESLAGSSAPVAAAPVATPAPRGAAAAVPASQPDFTALKDDFIPGEKILLFDDFTDMAPDEAPPHWKVRGAALALMQAGSVRQIVATRKTTLTPMVDHFPQNFTVETEVLPRWSTTFPRTSRSKLKCCCRKTVGRAGISSRPAPTNRCSRPGPKTAPRAACASISALKTTCSTTPTWRSIFPNRSNRRFGSRTAACVSI